MSKMSDHVSSESSVSSDSEEHIQQEKYAALIGFRLIGSPSAYFPQILMYAAILNLLQKLCLLLLCPIRMSMNLRLKLKSITCPKFSGPYLYQG